MNALLETSTFLNAKERYDQLIAQTRIREGKWRSDAWPIIEKRLKDEAPLMNSCEPSGVCTYLLYAEIACQYLVDVHDVQRFKKFRSMITGDVSKFAAFSTVVDDSEVAESDKQLMAASIKGFTQCATELHKYYPDT